MNHATGPGQPLKMRVGCELVYDFPQPTPMIATLSIHYSLASAIVVPDLLRTTPAVPISSYRDTFGNWCTRLVAPTGRFSLSTDGIVSHLGQPDPVAVTARQHPVEQLPEETLIFLSGSRYCETDRLSEIAWKLFSSAPSGWARVQRIVDYVHSHITFGYEHADSTHTAWDVFHSRKGVCRDFAHLAVTFCRCMNIPARYCTGYVSDIGTPPPYPPNDFAAWFEVYLGGDWHMFDPRNNTPRIGRFLIARGRDAADVPLTTTFGPNELLSLRVWTEEQQG